MKLLLFCLLVGATNALEWNSLWDKWTTCEYTKAEALECLHTHVDTNNDRAISQKEVFAAIVENPSAVVRAFSWAKTMLANKLFTQCDYNQDGLITARDLKLAEKTCLTSNHALCLVQWICRGFAE